MFSLARHPLTRLAPRELSGHVHTVVKTWGWGHLHFSPNDWRKRGRVSAGLHDGVLLIGTAAVVILLSLLPRIYIYIAGCRTIVPIFFLVNLPHHLCKTNSGHGQYRTLNWKLLPSDIRGDNVARAFRAGGSIMLGDVMSPSRLKSAADQELSW